MDEEERERGAENANRATVRYYLEKEYGLTHEQAQALVEKHHDEVERGERLLSFAHYVGDQIMKKEQEARGG